MNAQCPHCGKTNRPGAQFCGFCGEDMSKAKPPIPTAGPTPPSAAPSPPSAPPEVPADRAGNPCSHCGQTVRAGVKFCASCGKAVAAPVSPPVKPPDLLKPPSPIPPIDQDPQQPPPQRDKFFPQLRQQLAQVPLWMKLLVLIGLVVLCVTLGLIVWNVGFESRATPSPTVSAMEESAIGEVSGEAETPKPGPRLQAESPTMPPQLPTATEQPTEAPLPTETEETAPPTPEPTAAQASDDAAPAPVLFEDDFEGDIERQWDVWGEPPFPEVNAELGFLELSGQGFEQALLTARESVRLYPGVVIEFHAKVAGMDTNRILYLDWFPGLAMRPPHELGPLHLNIGDGKISLYHRNRGCDLPIQDTNFQTYRLEVAEASEGMAVDLFVDGVRQDGCSGISFPSPPDSVGRITLSGYGWVDWLTITMP